MPKSRQSSRAKPAGGEPPVRTLALRLPASYRLPAHGHGWAQAVYAARGVMAVEARSMQWIVPPLRCLWVPAGLPHGIETMGETWMRTVYIRPDLAADMPGTVRVLEVRPLLRELILEVVRRGVPQAPAPAHSRLASVLIDLLGQSRELGLSLPLPSDPRTRAVADKVRRSPGATASLVELARGTGASPRTVERLFLNETGLSFGRWRQQACLQFAVRRLAEGASVTDAALDCGYESVSAFISMFKRSLGATPSQYINATESE